VLWATISVLCEERQSEALAPLGGDFGNLLGESWLEAMLALEKARATRRMMLGGRTSSKSYRP